VIWKPIEIGKQKKFYFLSLSNNSVPLQIDYSWPSLTCKSSSSMFKDNKKVFGPPTKSALIQTLKQRQWRYIIPPSSSSTSSINNWSLKFSGSVNLILIFHNHKCF
jgi:hypothetical protein